MHVPRLHVLAARERAAGIQKEVAHDGQPGNVVRRLHVRLAVRDHAALYHDIRSVLQENSVVAIAASLTARLRVNEAVVDSHGPAAAHDDAVSAAWADL